LEGDNGESPTSTQPSHSVGASIEKQQGGERERGGGGGVLVGGNVYSTKSAKGRGSTVRKKEESSLVKKVGEKRG